MVPPSLILLSVMIPWYFWEICQKPMGTKSSDQCIKLVLQRGTVYVYIYIYKYTHRTENSPLLSHLWGVAPSTFQVVYILYLLNIFPIFAVVDYLRFKWLCCDERWIPIMFCGVLTCAAGEGWMVPSWFVWLVKVDTVHTDLRNERNI